MRDIALTRRFRSVRGWSVGLRHYTNIAGHLLSAAFNRLRYNDLPLAQFIARQREFEEAGAALGEVAKSLVETMESALILPGLKHEALRSQLPGLERVHPGDLHLFERERIGGVDNVYRVFGRWIPGEHNNGVPFLLSAIYTARMRISSDGTNFGYEQIPGDIIAVRDSALEQFQQPQPGDTVVALLYSVSNRELKSVPGLVKGGGRAQAYAAHAALHEEARAQGYNVIVSTLSPIRGFTQWLNQRLHSNVGLNRKTGKVSDDFMESLQDLQTQHTLREQVLYYLLTHLDAVGDFHLRNGAVLGNINFTGDPRDPITINWVYPDTAEQCEANAQLYQRDKSILMAPHIHAIAEQVMERALYPSCKPAIAEAKNVPGALLHAHAGIARHDTHLRM